MKIRLITILAAGAAIAGGISLMKRRVPSVMDPKSVEKALSSAAKRSTRSAEECDAFFLDWEESMKAFSPLDERKLSRLSDHLGRYPGIPAGTHAAWKILATQLPEAGETDVSFAYGLSDCQFSKYVKMASDTLADTAREGGAFRGRFRVAGALLIVLREVLAKPVSRQTLLECVTLIRSMRAGGWIEWEKGDDLLWERTQENLRKFNQRADKHESEVTQKVSKSASFTETTPEDRKAIAIQLRHSFIQTEKTRQSLELPVSRIRLVSKNKA